MVGKSPEKSTSMLEKIILNEAVKDSNVIESIRSNMPDATSIDRGLMPPSQFYSMSNSNDANNCLEEGAYVIPSGAINTPNEDYSVMRVIRVSIYVIQIFITLNYDRFYYRKSINSGKSFGPWITLK